MKLLAGFVLGVLLTMVIPYWLTSTEPSQPSQRDLAIVVYVNNDSSKDFILVELETDKDHKLSCTLRAKKCSFIISDSGDIGFNIKATDRDGVVWSGTNQHSYYGEPGTTHSLPLSSLTNKHLTNTSTPTGAQNAPAG